MIPEHWEVKRIKDISYMYSGLTGKSGDDFRCDDENLTKFYIPFTNALNNTVVDTNQFMRVVMSEDEKQNAVKENDIIFLMSSEDYESIAKSAVVIGDPGEVYLNSFCRGIRITSNSVYSPFVNYQLNSEVYRDALRFEARGFTRINIKIDRIAGHFVSLPTYEEQQDIATYLDEKCAKIDVAIVNIDKQTDALKRLKRSLINEVITGQRAI
jgi:type I restriction enzyme S subunit